MANSSASVADRPKVAVIIPCYNEEISIGKVVKAFRAALPTAIFYVYDNNSSDKTIEVARAAGAIVRSEPQQGKGNVVRRMFADIEADAYVLVDGDNTYDASAAPAMVDMLFEDSLDMVTGCRVTEIEIEEAYRRGHRFGNWMLAGLVSIIFGRRTKDMLSGYRIFSKRFVKSFPALSSGFEIETEFTVHALELRLPIADYDTAYVDRLPGSESKLRTFHDGFRILRLIGSLVKKERPFQLFSIIALVLFLIALVLGLPLVDEFIETGLVPRIPTAVLAASIMVIAILSFISGLILDIVTLGRKEAKRLHYLSIPTAQTR